MSKNERFSKKTVATYIRKTAINIQKEHGFDLRDGTAQIHGRMAKRISRIRGELPVNLSHELTSLLWDLEKVALAYGRKEALNHIMREFELGQVEVDLPEEE